MKSSANRNLIESLKICEAMQDFLNTNRTPWTANDLCYCLRTKIEIIVQARIMREILKGMLERRFKKGLIRLMSFDEERNILIKQWFTIKLWRVLDRFKY